MITHSDEGPDHDHDPEDPLTVILRPPTQYLGPPAGRYEAIRRGAARRRLLRAAAGAALTCGVAALVILPLRLTATDTPGAPTVPLAPPPASSPSTVPGPSRVPSPSASPEDSTPTKAPRESAAPGRSATAVPGEGRSLTPTPTPTSRTTRPSTEPSQVPSAQVSVSASRS
ncbi:hypothetical protein ABZ848_33970 [Streptomyces sp. NPDC047081]|uniref:hypothetical protein n=1 Tax=Streptomyces sp. NPDC047081 TaxID=3154706 RepID=UPI0033EBAD53